MTKGNEKECKVEKEMLVLIINVVLRKMTVDVNRSCHRRRPPRLEYRGGWSLLDYFFSGDMLEHPGAGQGTGSWVRHMLQASSLF